MGEQYAAARSQQAFWTLAALRPGSSLGNECVLLRLRGALDASRLSAALDHLEERHDAWRTCYALDEGQLVGTVHAPHGGLLETLDLSSHGPDRDALDGALQAEIEDRVLAPFDLATPRLLRPTLFRLAAGDHALLLVSHHVAMDGTSLFSLLPAQIAAAYERGDTPRGEALGAPFRALAIAESETPVRPEDLSHWRRHLEDASFVLDLPVDHARPAARRMTGERLRRELDGPERARLERLAEQLEVGLYDLLAGSLAILLHRYTAQDSFLLGTVHAGRRQPERRDVFGCLMRTLPLRFDFHDDADMPLATFLQRVHAERRAAFDRLDVPVDDLLAELAPTDPSRNPGYQVLFNYMPFSERTARFADLDVEAWRPDPRWTLTDLSFDVIDDGTTLACVLDRDTSLFDASTAEVLLGAWLTAIRALPEALDGAIGALPLLDATARTAVLEAGRGPDAPVPPITLHELVERQVRATPDAIALVHRDTRLRYDALWARSETLAARLTPHLRAAATPYVLLLLEDPVDAIVAMLATLRAGGAYVPVDPSQPAGRLQAMLEDAPPAVAIVDDAIAFDAAPRIPPHASSEENAAASFEAPQVSAEAPCYVIFTSGSTGRPKGVRTRHRNVVHQVDARSAFYGRAPGRTLSAYSFAFDAAVACLYGVLGTGGTLVLPAAGDRGDPQVLRHVIASERIQTLDVPPALYPEILAAGPEALASLETVILGGEAMPTQVARSHRAQLPDTRLVNEYGPTETTVFSTALVVDDEAEGPIPIGRPIRRTRCAVVDAYGQLVPRGGVGELVIGGAGVAEGYVNRAELTSDVFVSASWASGSDRVYRTGDRVRLDALERFVFLGRADQQVQIRGYRVEPGEVEATLCRIDGIEQAIVVAQGEPDLQLDAYVVLAPGASPQTEDWARKLREALPAPLVPATITPVDGIPRLPSGKIDEGSLPRPSRTIAPAATHWRVQPHSQTEQKIYDVMRRTLDVDALGVEDDFFEQGGTSIVAVRFLAELEKQTDFRVPLRTFVANPSVARLAEALHREEGLGEEPLVVVLKEGDGRPPFWIVHPVGGHVVFASQMAARWNAGHALYGIQAPGLDGHRDPIESMQEAATTYLELIREKQPEGPYFLGGPSLGGLIAYEMAQQLTRQGETVGMVALLDCYGPNFPARSGRARRVFDHATRILSLGPREGWRYLRTRIERSQGREEADWLKYDFGDEGETGDRFDAIRRVQAACERMADAYTPTPYPGELHMFRALHTPQSPGYRFDDPKRGWGPFAGKGVHVTDVDGSHHSMLDEPEVADLAHKLETAFETQLGAHGLVPRRHA